MVLTVNSNFNSSSQNAKIEYAAQSVVQNSELSNEQSQI